MKAALSMLEQYRDIFQSLLRARIRVRIKLIEGDSISTFNPQSNDGDIILNHFRSPEDEGGGGSPSTCVLEEYAAHSLLGPLSFARHPLPQYSSLARNAHPLTLNVTKCPDGQQTVSAIPPAAAHHGCVRLNSEVHLLTTARHWLSVWGASHRPMSKLTEQQRVRAVRWFSRRQVPHGDFSLASH